MVDGRASDQWKTSHTYSFSNKKFKQNISVLDSSSDNEAESTSSSITNLSQFIIEKFISKILIPVSVKKLENETLLAEIEKRKYMDFLLKMTKFHIIPVKTNPHESLNVSKEVGQSKEF